jgi:hypothetical protein
VLDAMAYLSCIDGRYDAAALIIACADVAHEAHGQARRRPIEARMRERAAAMLDAHLGPAWSARAANGHERLDEAGASALALGLRD